MGRALELAAAAQEWGDTPIGAVVLGPDGPALAEAANEREKRGDPTAHAEVLALRAAAQERGDGWRLTGCTLVVTLEPCTMCAGASVLARVARVVYGADDPKAGAAGSLWDVVRDRRLNHRPEVVAGVRAEECGALLRAFFRGPQRGSVVSPAVACPSGRRSTPRKRVRGKPPWVQIPPPPPSIAGLSRTPGGGHRDCPRASALRSLSISSWPFGPGAA